MKLFTLAVAGNVEGLRAALAEGAPVEEGIEDCTPLMAAARSHEAGVDALEVLVAHGADVNAVRLLAFGGDRRPLQLAIEASSLAKVEYLISVGADVGYRSDRGHDALFDVACAQSSETEIGPSLALVRCVLDHGARVDGETRHGDSAIAMASLDGRMDLVRLLLERGASFAALGWGPLARAVGLGTLADVEAALRDGDDRTRRDRARRTPWILSLELGDRAKAERLLEAGVDRDDKNSHGRSAAVLAASLPDPALLARLIDEGFGLDDGDVYGMTPLMHAAAEGHVEAARLLLEQGTERLEARDTFGSTPLAHAVGADRVEVARLLLQRGADVHAPPLESHHDTIVSRASSRPMLALLLDAGVDLADTSKEMRRALRDHDDARLPSVTAEEVRTGAGHRFGTANPERMVVPFWDFMIVWARSAGEARGRFEPEPPDQQIWCYERFGRSITFVPGGPMVEIGGEHEDYYDRDFIIYNDVVVHHGGGAFTVFGYPKEVFPPTDFHTATYHRGGIYVVGGVGYRGERAFGTTPVYRLDCATFAMERVATSGPEPGWIHRHRARLEGGERLVVSGGEISTEEGGVEVSAKNARSFTLDLGTGRWTESG